MNLTDARALAKGLMAQHGLDAQGWRFRFDRSVVRFGCCNYSKRLITVSAPLVKLNDEAMVKNTLLHEIAHAIVGMDGRHGPVWQAKALSIGCNGQRTHTANAPERMWQAVCSACGKPCGRYFRRRNLLHRHCGGKIFYKKADIIESVNGGNQ